ncbi:4936_t:CDS:2 [Diversispora eburnea]|uniref:4936_t:CDS:1 n=1 Tax=Diversispora eburnea TaxID=1213867 RepID=A0A9N8YSR1_9GLOM|nr:4936_t:CDS:2 [Diversispora eburnea]
MNMNRLAALICCLSFSKRSKNINTKNEKDILTSVSESVEFDFSSPTTPQELNQRKKRYGVCLNCGYPLSDKSWCQFCEGQKLQQNFNNWSSGNQFIDNFIQSSQLKPLNKNGYLSWIPYDDLIQVRYMANGGFSAVYSALWDHFETGQVVDVVLKRLHNGRTSDPEFLREQIAMFVYAASQKSSVIRCYGMTLHPTEGYMLVMEYGEEGDLRSYLRGNHSALLWSDKVYMIRDIAKSLEVLHSREFVHGDLHTGNILKKLPKNSSPPIKNRLRKFISGLGLLSENSRERELSDICKDVRPPIDRRSMPQFYADLIRRCWDPEPSNRPSARIIREIIDGWILSIQNLSPYITVDEKSLSSTIKNPSSISSIFFHSKKDGLNDNDIDRF